MQFTSRIAFLYNAVAKYFSGWILIDLGRISVSMFFLFSCIACNAAHGGDDFDLNEFYTALERLQDKPPARQIEELQNCLEKNPDFEPVYSKLLELYSMENKTSEAKIYFKQLALNYEYFSNSHWMLAKIFAKEDSLEVAFESIVKALHKAKLSKTMMLIRDFADFVFQYRAWSNELLDRVDLTHEQQLFLAALAKIKQDKPQKALDLFRELSKQYADNALLMHYKGVCYYELKQFLKADSIWQRGAQLATFQGDRDTEAWIKSNLGVLAQKRSDFNQASIYFDQADSIAFSIGNLYRLQFVAGRKADLMKKLGNDEEALAQLKRAIDIAIKIDEYDIAASRYSDLGSILQRTRHYYEALNSYQLAEEHAIKAKNQKKQVQMNINIGNIFSFLYLNSLAKYRYEQAHTIASRNNLSKEKKKALSRLADLMVREQEYERARKIYSEIIISLGSNARPVDLVYWTWQLANTYYEQGLLKEALNEFKSTLDRAIEIDSPYHIAWTLLRLASIYELNGNFDKAIQTYNDDVILSVAKEKRTFIEQQFGLGRVYEKRGELEAAISAFRKAVNAIEGSRQSLKVEQFRIGFFSEENQPYRHLTQCYLKRFDQSGSLADLDSLYHFEKLRKARALLDSRLRQPSRQSSDSDSSYVQYLQSSHDLQKLQRQIRQSPASFDSLKIRHETLRFSLIEKKVRLVESATEDSVSPDFQVDGLAHLSRTLKKQNLGLLQYHISAENSFVFVVSGKEVTVIKLQLNPDLLAQSIDSLMAPFHNVDEDSISSTPFRTDVAYELYELLIEPVEEGVASLPRQLVIVPDLSLMQLPFEMLLIKRQQIPEYTPRDDPSYKDDFLGLRYSFVYSPSPSFLPKNTARTQTNPDVLVFANPFVAPSKSTGQGKLRHTIGWRFDPLRYAKREAVAIENLYSNTRIFDGGAATEKNLIKHASKVKVLHFATHAFADLIFHDFSGLVLAAGDDSTDDGILMGYEIPDLELDTDLVTLSACETGRGAVVAGEGILGLPRQFLAAGAKSVLMTHWKVDDKFASELIPEFYREYLKEGLSKSEALSKAKNKILENSTRGKSGYYQHPFFWASFVLYGEPGTERRNRMPFVAIGLIIILSPVIFFLFKKIRNVKIQQYSNLRT